MHTDIRLISDPSLSVQIRGLPFSGLPLCPSMSSVVKPDESLRYHRCMRLAQQLQFILELDKLKTVLRRNLLSDGSRVENSAEHSWHLAAMAGLLAEYAAEPVDVMRVTRMLLVHDVVEIDAGDTYAYDPAANVGRAEREEIAARRVFGLLPPDQAGELRQLWDEFEAVETAESRYANALDRLQPLILNFHSRGESWRRHGVTAAQVRERMRPIQTGAPELWSVVEDLLKQAVERGYLS